jgi:hypothetical protein
MTDRFDIGLNGHSFDIVQLDITILDITSYLSVPNHINTCNKHARTADHVFKVWSDMGWQQNLTDFYNLVRHNVDKIVEDFVHENGQIYKVERGNLKIQLLIDWSISARLLVNRY